ncbi:nucleotidyltransferase domain-containing protein [Microbacterium elymi]|uniref:Antitoxin n=1 Tax=Microbacterium elymi TaxID=2909587 RepID=A0ABY5NMH7_9MICO|nr:nucleotidyltransferase domain-containing protein [Microbacterium elymi]UUT36375.1 nucleotidyltransferase domain-containing protein [Microbacterium elymi]
MDVIPVADARAGLSGLIARFRADPEADPVVIGTHRRPEVVLLSVQAYRQLTDAGAAGITIDRLRTLKPVIERLAAASGLSGVRVYGSVARGDQRPDSDLDLLVTPEPGATLFDIAQFELDVETVLGVPVSAVPVTALDDTRDQRILAEAVAL